MEDKKIYEVVKSVSKYMIGFKPEEKYLVNDNGMQLHFYSSWNNKTTISGVGARHSHSIGCSFEKDPERIANDIYRRLYDAYRDDFLNNKKEIEGREKNINDDMQKLDAICSVIDGAAVHENYGNYKKYNRHVRNKQIEVSQDYKDNYDLKINLNFSETLKVVNLLKEHNLIKGE